MGLAASERAALADLLADLGPAEPTLCAGWLTGDLLAHLLVRERRPDAVPGMFLKPLAGWTAKVAAGFSAVPWAEQVEEFRSGPPRWNPTGWAPLAEISNAAEMFIHHEDARRGQPAWQPRQLDTATRAAVVAMLGSAPVRLALRKVRVGVTAVFPDGGGAALRAGSPVVEVRGEPAEVLLWASGRTAVRLQCAGDPGAVAALAAAGFGLPTPPPVDDGGAVDR